MYCVYVSIFFPKTSCTSAAARGVHPPRLAVDKSQIKSQVTLRVSISQAVVGSMREDMQQATLPIIHYQVDLWACEVSARKFVGVHVYWVTSELKLRHALLAVSEYQRLHLGRVLCDL